MFSQYELLKLIALLVSKESTMVSQHKLLNLSARRKTATLGRTSTLINLYVLKLGTTCNKVDTCKKSFQDLKCVNVLYYELE